MKRGQVDLMPKESGGAGAAAGSFLRRLITPAAISVFLLWPVCSAASESTPVVRMTLESAAVRGRTGGPIRVQVRLEYNRPQILEGHLLLKFYVGTRVDEVPLLTQRIEDIVLHGTDRSFSLLIPPLPESYTGNYEVEAWFETDSGRIPLSSSRTFQDPPDPFTILSGSPTVRNLVLASVTGSPDGRRMTARRLRLHQLLSPDMFRVREEGIYAGQVTWSPSSPSADELPQDPLFLCSVDVVLLCERALARSTSEQLEALLTWTRAGGSVCVVTEEFGLAARHVAFLQELLHDAEQEDLRITRDGRILMPEESGIVAAYVELGRCVVLPSRSVETLTENQARRMRDFLWKVRGVHLFPSEMPTEPRTAGPAESSEDSVITGVRKGDAVGRPGAVTLWDPHDDSLPGDRPLAITWCCPYVLMPKDVQMVPLPVIAGLLTAYVLAVGPLDYWLLGLFRARKYTWVMFPLVTAVFTFAIVQTARSYLSSAATGGEFRITDIGRDGRPLRESVLDLKFIGTHAEVSQSNQSRMVSWQLGGFFTSGPPTWRDASVSGRFPQDYTLRRSLEQWVPGISRTLTFSPREIPELLSESGSEREGVRTPDWSDEKLVTTPAGREQLRRWLDKVFPGSVLSAGVYHGRDEYVLTGSRILSEMFFPAERSVSVSNYWNYWQFHADPTNEASHYEFLRLMAGSACFGRPVGFRRRVGQVSPGGALSMEDVVVLDLQNPDQWLLAVLLKTDSGYHLIRRLYCCPQTE